MTPTIVIDGETAEEWMANLFEFELCDECFLDADDHEPLIVLGHWFARCKWEVHGEGGATYWLPVTIKVREEAIT